jgi:hypothetical protein
MLIWVVRPVLITPFLLDELTAYVLQPGATSGWYETSTARLRGARDDSSLRIVDCVNLAFGILAAEARNLRRTSRLQVIDPEVSH